MGRPKRGGNNYLANPEIFRLGGLRHSTCMSTVRAKKGKEEEHIYIYIHMLFHLFLSMFVNVLVNMIVNMMRGTRSCCASCGEPGWGAEPCETFVNMIVNMSGYMSVT